MELKLTIRDEAALSRLGAELAKGLFPGAFIALFGGLGAGKTTLAKAIGRALGIEDIQSPTFTIVREHMGRLPLFHFDAYRLEDEDELYAMGYEDYLARNGVIIMEWCENVPCALPPERLDIRISGSGMEPRELHLRPRGSRYEAMLEDISC